MSTLADVKATLANVKADLANVKATIPITRARITSTKNAYTLELVKCKQDIAAMNATGRQVKSQLPAIEASVADMKRRHEDAIRHVLWSERDLVELEAQVRHVQLVDPLIVQGRTQHRVPQLDPTGLAGLTDCIQDIPPMALAAHQTAQAWDNFAGGLGCDLVCAAAAPGNAPKEDMELAKANMELAKARADLGKAREDLKKLETLLGKLSDVLQVVKNKRTNVEALHRGLHQTLEQARRWESDIRAGTSEDHRIIERLPSLSSKSSQLKNLMTPILHKHNCSSYESFKKQYGHLASVNEKAFFEVSGRRSIVDLVKHHPHPDKWASKPYSLDETYSTVSINEATELLNQCQQVGL